MFNSTLLFIHEKGEKADDIAGPLKESSRLFKKTIISTQYPEVMTEFDHEIVLPFSPSSEFSKLYSGLFFSGEEKITAVSLASLPVNAEAISILLKNFHKGVDASLFMEDNEVLPFPGVYSDRIINKFKDTVADRLDESFLKRLKINKIKRPK